MKPDDFPQDFIFGAATSAYQIEGCQNDGRGKSIWDTFFAARPHLDNGATAIAHCARMEEDVKLMAKLGLQSYRFSVSWPRVLPEGKGSINQRGLDFYDRLVNTLLEHGIVPNLTLYHWDLPQALEDLGGWTSRDIPKYFADYAGIIGRAFGDRVPFIATLNEPEVITAGYIGKDLAPGYGRPELRMKVIHHLLLAHGLGMQALRAESPRSQLGLVVNLVPIDPLTESARNAAQRRWLREYAVYLEAAFRGKYPDVVSDEIIKSGVVIEPGDMEIVSEKTDFLGVNWYLRMVVDENDCLIEVPGVERTLMGWEIRAEALTRTLVSIWRDYELPPIYITENGAALYDKVEAGFVRDEQRVSYINDHLHAVSLAIKHGVSVRGYYVWSLFDNLEWAFGYSKTFGIVHVDRETLQRTPKQSALWYGELIKQHSRS